MPSPKRVACAATVRSIPVPTWKATSCMRLWSTLLNPVGNVPSHWNADGTWAVGPQTSAAARGARDVCGTGELGALATSVAVASKITSVDLVIVAMEICMRQHSYPCKSA